MDTTVCTVVKRGVIHGEADLKLMCTVINLQSKQKELVKKVLDASDQCQEIIDMLLSSKNTTLDLVQKIVRANNQDLNLMTKITDLNSTEWDLFRKIIHLCDGKKYFIYKFMDWYLNDESLGFPCSSSGKEGVKLDGKSGPCKVKEHNDTVGQRHRMVSSDASRQGNGNEKFRTRRTNQGTKRNDTVGQRHRAVSSYASRQGNSNEKLRIHRANQGTKRTDTVGQRHRVVSSYASRQGNSSEKFRTRRTNQGTKRNDTVGQKHRAVSSYALRRGNGSEKFRIHRANRGTKHNDTVGQRHRVVSSDASREGNSSEKFRAHQTNQGTSTEKLGKSCRENGLSLSKTDARTEDRGVTKQVNLTEKEDSSEVVAQQAQPTMTVKHLPSNEHLCSGSSQSSENVAERPVSHIEHNDLGSKQKTIQQLDYAGDNGNSTSRITVVCGTSNTREDVTGAHEEVSLNTKSAIPPFKNVEVKEDQTLALGTNHNCHSIGVKESVKKLPNIGMKQAVIPLLPKQNMDMEVHEQQMYNGSLQGNLSDILTSRISAVESTGIKSQNDILNDSCVPGSGRTETQLDLSGKVNSKTSCYIQPKKRYLGLRVKWAIFFFCFSFSAKCGFS